MNKIRKTFLGLGLALITAGGGLAGLAWAQGQPLLATLLGTELVTVRNAGPLAPETTINTIASYVLTNNVLNLACPSYFVTGTPAATDQVFFVAPRAFRVVSISEVHAVAAGGASVIQVVKDTTTAAPGTGTDLLTNNTNTGFDLNATANTVQVGTLVATAGVTSLAAGDRLSVDYANTIQSTSGVVITACLTPI